MENFHPVRGVPPWDSWTILLAVPVPNLQTSSSDVFHLGLARSNVPFSRLMVVIPCSAILWLALARSGQASRHYELLQVGDDRSLTKGTRYCHIHRQPRRRRPLRANALALNRHIRPCQCILCFSWFFSVLWHSCVLLVSCQLQK